MYDKRKLKNMINFEFGSAKSQRKINTANLDVKIKNTTLSDLLHCQKTKALLPSANYIFSLSRVNMFF